MGLERIRLVVGRACDLCLVRGLRRVPLCDRAAGGLLPVAAARRRRRAASPRPNAPALCRSTADHRRVDRRRGAAADRCVAATRCCRRRRTAAGDLCPARLWPRDRAADPRIRDNRTVLARRRLCRRRICELPRRGVRGVRAPRLWLRHRRSPAPNSTLCSGTGLGARLGRRARLGGGTRLGAGNAAGARRGMSRALAAGPAARGAAGINRSAGVWRCG